MKVGSASLKTVLRHCIRHDGAHSVGWEPLQAPAALGVDQLIEKIVLLLREA